MSYRNFVIDQIEAAFEGGAKQIPFSLSSLSNVTGIRQGIYTLLGGSTGSGKTTWVDQEYVLQAYQYVKTHPEYKLRVFYHSMERRKAYKLQKWTSWKIYQDTGNVVTSDQMLAYQALGPNMTPSDILDLTRKYEGYFDEMMDNVVITDGSVTPKTIFYSAQAYAFENGSYYATLREPGPDKPSHLMLNNVKIAEFSPSQYYVDKVGKHRMYLEITHKGKPLTITAHENRYFPNDPNEFVLIILDHMGKLTPEKGMDKWATIAEMSTSLGNLRDRYLFSPIAINQFNRSLGDIQRSKLYGDDLLPQLEDFEGQAVTQHDADLILALFDPVRYKRENCLDYEMDRMRSPGGHNRFRSVSVLKNTTGIDQVHLGMRFTGEVGLFEGLPFHDSPDMRAMYKSESLGQGNRS